MDCIFIIYSVPQFFAENSLLRWPRQLTWWESLLCSFSPLGHFEFCSQKFPLRREAQLVCCFSDLHKTNAKTGWKWVFVFVRRQRSKQHTSYSFHLCFPCHLTKFRNGFSYDFWTQLWWQFITVFFIAWLYLKHTSASSLKAISSNKKDIHWYFGKNCIQFQYSLMLVLFSLIVTPC